MPIQTFRLIEAPSRAAAPYYPWQKAYAAALRDSGRKKVFVSIERATVAIEKRYGEWGSNPGTEAERKAIQKAISTLRRIVAEKFGSDVPLQGKLYRLQHPKSRSIQKAGQRLRTLRESLGLSLRDVFKESKTVAARKHNRAFLVSPSLLSLIENKGLAPTIYRLHSLAQVYETSMRKLLSFYGL